MRFSLRIFQDSSKGACLVLFSVLLLDGIAEQLILITQHSKYLFGSCALLVPVAATVIFAYRLIFRLEDETYVTRVALAIVLLSLVLRLIWVFAVGSYQVNDFGEYLNNATDKTDTLWRRAVFYTYPLVLTFGKSLAALKITNVLMATVTTWIFFLAGKIVVGTRTAALALLFFMWHPDLWYSMTLASHDIPGLFWLALFFYLAVLLQRRLLADSKSWFSNLLISVFLGMCVFFVGAVRSYQYGAIIALAACAVAHSIFIIFTETAKQNRPFGQPQSSGLAPQRAPISRRFKYAVLHTALLLVLPVAVYYLAQSRVWTALKVNSDGVGSGFACYLSATDVLGTSEHDEIANWYEEQCPIIKKDEQNEFAFRRLMLEITHSPLEYLLHIERKNRILSREDAYLGWSTSTTYEAWDTTHDQVKRINGFNYYTQQAAIALANAVLILLVLWRILLCPTQLFRPAAIVPVVFSAAYYGMFLFLLENQSRYGIFLIFMFSWMAAEAVVDLRRRSYGNLPSPVTASAFKRLYLGGTAILLATAGAYTFASSLVAESALTLRNQAGFTEAPPGSILDRMRGSPEITPAFVKNNFKQLVLGYPEDRNIPAGSVMAVQRTFPVAERLKHHLRFFLSTDEVRSAPYESTTNCKDANVEYFIAVNREPIASGRLNDIPGNKYFSFDSATSAVFAPQMTLQLILRNLSGIQSTNCGPIVSLEYIDLQ